MTLYRFDYAVVVMVDSDEPVPSADVRKAVVTLLEGETLTTEDGDAVIDQVVVS